MAKAVVSDLGPGGATVVATRERPRASRDSHAVFGGGAVVAGGTVVACEPARACNWVRGRVSKCSRGVRVISGERTSVSGCSNHVYWLSG